MSLDHPFAQICQGFNTIFQIPGGGFISFISSGPHLYFPVVYVECT